MIPSAPIPALGGESAGPRLSECFAAGPAGRLEVLSMEPDGEAGGPVLWFLPGWWANAGYYEGVLRHFAAQGWRARCLSWRGTGKSGGGSFWGFCFEHDLVAAMRHFRDEEVVLVAHSGAADPARLALPLIQRSDLARSVKALVVLAPLARSGSFPALMRFLKPDRSGTNLHRFKRFLGSNLFGLSWFMRDEVCIRRVLLSDYAPAESVARAMGEIDACPWGRYFLSLCRSFPGMAYSDEPAAKHGVAHAIVMHAEYDRNFSAAQQRDTAKALGAEFRLLERTCHQWFAEPWSFELTTGAVAEWLAGKGLSPRPAVLAAPGA